MRWKPEAKNEVGNEIRKGVDLKGTAVADIYCHPRMSYHVEK